MIFTGWVHISPPAQVFDTQTCTWSTIAAKRWAMVVLFSHDDSRLEDARKTARENGDNGEGDALVLPDSTSFLDAKLAVAHHLNAQLLNRQA